MPQALLGWELGGGLGHLARLRPVASRLLAAGWRVHLAAAQRGGAVTLFRELTQRWPGELTLGPAPSSATVAGKTFPTDTLADVLALPGYADALTLLPVAAGWQRPLDRLTPDLVVADYSPALCLVARGRTRLVVVGSGFTVPPLLHPLPPIRPWDADAPEASLAREERVLAACAAIARANGLHRPDCAAELLHGDASFACCLPLLDPYARHRAVPSWMPYSDGSVPNPRPWCCRPPDSALLYLSDAHPLAEPARRDLAGWAVISESFTTNLARVLADVRLAVHHGGLGTAHAALFAGTPQLLLPCYLEDHVTARALIRLGVASTRSAAKAMSDAELGTAIREATSEQVAAAAGRVAALVRSSVTGDDTLDAVIEACTGRR